MTKHGLVAGMSMAVLLSVGCARQPATTTSSAPAPTGAATRTGAPTSMAAPTSGARTGTETRPASQSGRPSGTSARQVPGEFAAVRDLADVHFDFDRYDIRPGDAGILDTNAAWLKKNVDQLVLIEGHCDERGTNEYNVALGERRAKATMNYLVAQGVASTRISIISYGEERPSCTARDEACWAKNRRAHFRVKRG